MVVLYSTPESEIPGVSYDGWRRYLDVLPRWFGRENRSFCDFENRRKCVQCAVKLEKSWEAYVTELPKLPWTNLYITSMEFEGLDRTQADTL